MELEKYAGTIAVEIGVAEAFVKNTLHLLETGATVPFIARYRKEMTGSMDETVITRVRDRVQQLKDLDARRESILKSLTDQEVLTEELEAAVMKAATMTELEDIYLPYKPKRRTRAMIAREKGLEPLARIIMTQREDDPEYCAEAYLDPEKGVDTVDDALQGASDIMAEWINEHTYARKQVRRIYQKKAQITSRVVKNKEEEGSKFETYFDVRESLTRAPSHRILAMFRGEKEGFLKVHIGIDEEEGFDELERIFLKRDNASGEMVQKAIRDSAKRLMYPSMETEMRQWIKEKADEEAIRVFAENLRQLLMAPPLGKSVFLPWILVTVQAVNWCAWMPRENCCIMKRYTPIRLKTR